MTSAPSPSPSPTERKGIMKEAPLMKESRNIMLPVDQSEHSERAVTWFLKYAFKPGDFLTLFHCVDTTAILPTYGPAPVSNVDAILKEKEKEVHALKKKFEKLLTIADVTGEFVATSKYGHAGEAIVNEAQERGIDYIVMGNRGAGRLRRTFMGSISDFVLHHSGLPITIIPPKRKKTTSTSSSRGSNSVSF